MRPRPGGGRPSSIVRALAWGLGLASVPGLCACKPRQKPAEISGPRLSVVLADGVTSAVRAAVTPESIALALGGLPPEELPRLTKHLAESTDGVLRRAAPELFDLEESPGDAGDGPLREVLLDLPALTAAANLLGSPWEAPGFSVRLGPVCEPAAPRCTALFASAGTPGDPLVRRARALAWALADAAILRVAPDGRARLLHALREAQLRPAGTIAMAFGASSGTLDATQLDLLRREARRALEQLPPTAPQRPWLGALDAARPVWELPVPLDPDQVLVVPRLSVLARLPDFVSEIESAGVFEWVARPGITRDAPAL